MHPTAVSESFVEAPDTQSHRPQLRGRTVRSIERWGSVAVGSALLAYGLSRKSKAGAAAAAAGATLLVAGATTVGRARDTREALAGDRGFHVHDAIQLEKPVEEVYRFWRGLENLPRFMRYLERVEDRGNGRSHWVARGPAGFVVEWDAEIVNEVENKVIGWRSLPDADVISAGSVHFDAVRGGRGTRLTVHLQYAPPLGRVGKLIAQLFGDEPAQAIREDLRRLKWRLEAGEIPRATPDQEPGGFRV